MKIEVPCPCGQRYSVSADLVGRSLKCKACSAVLPIEFALEAPAEPEPEPGPQAPAKRAVGKRSGTGPKRRPSPDPERQAELRRKAPKRRRPEPVKGVALGTVAVFILFCGGRAVLRRGVEKLADPLTLPNWSPHDSTAGGYSVEFPASPKVSNTTERTPEGEPYQVESLEVAAQASEFTALHMDLPPPDDPESINDEDVYGYLEEHVRSILVGEAYSSFMQGPKRLRIGDEPAVEALAVYGGAASPRKLLMVSVYVRAKNRLVFVCYEAIRPKYRESDARRFVDSLVLKAGP